VQQDQQIAELCIFGSARCRRAGVCSEKVGIDGARTAAIVLLRLLHEPHLGGIPLDYSPGSNPTSATVGQVVGFLYKHARESY